MTKAIWDNIELTEEGREVKCPTTLSDKLYSLEPYRRVGWTPEQLVDNGYARIIETSREKVINWLRENTTREQWFEHTSKGFFKGTELQDLAFTIGMSPIKEDEPRYYVSVVQATGQPIQSIHYQDVFEQPVFIDGAEYILHFNDEPPRHAWYKSSLNEFHEDMNSYPASGFGKHFTVELISDLSVAPVKPDSPLTHVWELRDHLKLDNKKKVDEICETALSRLKEQHDSPLYDRIVKALGDRKVPIAGKSHLVGQVVVDHRKAVLLDKVIEEFNIPTGGDVIKWLHNRTAPKPEIHPDSPFYADNVTLTCQTLDEETRKHLREVFSDPSTTPAKSDVHPMHKLGNYLGMSDDAYSHDDILTEALNLIKKLQEPDGLILGLNYLLGLDVDSGDVEIFNTVEKLVLINDDIRVKRGVARNKYDREILPGVYVDVYDVLGAFPTESPAIDHAVKKLLAPGQRGVKDRITDLNEAIGSIQREIDRIGEWSVSEDIPPSMNKVRESMGIEPIKGLGDDQ